MMCGTCGEEKMLSILVTAMMAKILSSLWVCSETGKLIVCPKEDMLKALAEGYSQDTGQKVPLPLDKHIEIKKHIPVAMDG